MNELIRPQKQIAKGILLIIIACFFNAVQAFCVKLSATDISTLLLVPLRMGFNLFALLLFFLIKYRVGREWKQIFATKRIGLHLIRAGTGIAGLYAYFLSLVYLNLAEATVIFFSFPLFVPLINYFWQKIRLFHHIWWGLITAFIGLIIALHIGPFFSPLVIIPLVGSFLSAIAIVSIRQLQYSESSSTIITYFYGVGVIVSVIIFLFMRDRAFVHFSSTLWTLLAVIGVTSTLYTVFTTAALKFAPARLVTPFFYSIILFSILFDILFLKCSPTIFTYIGAALMILGVVLIALLYPEDDYNKRVPKKRK